MLSTTIAGLLLAARVAGAAAPGSAMSADVVIGEKCGGTYNMGSYGYLPKVWTLHTYVDADGVTRHYVTCGPNARHARPASISELVPSPVTREGQSFTAYKFISYPFAQLGGVQARLPANDPITVGNRDPSGGNSGFAEEILIDADDAVAAPMSFGPGASGSISWLPQSIFDNHQFWNLPMAYTFQVSRDEGSAKWYPLNFFTVSDPTSKIPLVPVEIKWAEVAGAAKYRFKLTAAENPLGSNTNLSQPVDVLISSPRSYAFSGRASVGYSWSATPLDAAGNPIIGEPIVRSPVMSFTQPSLALPDGAYAYGWDGIPGAARYEIQYALSFRAIPMGTPFADLATFSESSVTTTGGTGGPITQTAYVLGANCPTCKLGVSQDLEAQTPGFQFDFAASPLAALSTPTHPQPSLHWRIRALDAAGNVIRQPLVQSGYAYPPLPTTPYQSADVSWPLVAGATSYVVDVVENLTDFGRLPALVPAGTTLGMAGSAVARARAQSAQTGARQGGSAGGSASETVGSRIFLLRRVVADYRQTAQHPGFDAGAVTVSKFAKLLRQSRMYMGDAHRAAGFYDDDPAAEPQFENEARAATNNFTTFTQASLDGYYPLVAADLAMVVATRKEKPSLLPNQIELRTGTPVTIVDRSAGNAKLGVVRTNGGKTIVLTFATKNSSGASGEYSFQMSKDAYAPASIRYSLTYSTFGPVAVIGNLTGKGYAGFGRLLPNQTYYWRVRALQDPQVLDPNSVAPFTWHPWSEVGSFTTPSGIPTLLTVGSDTAAQTSEMRQLERMDAISPTAVPGGNARKAPAPGRRN